METLDGFILNLFRTEKPELSKQDFENDNVWVCDLLNQDIDLANEYVKYKLGSCSDRMDKLEFLYSSRSCFKYTIEELENELNPDYQSEYTNFRGRMTKEQMVERLNRYKKALTMTDQAICFYIDCSTIDCKDKKKTTLEYSNAQMVLIFYYFFKQNGLEPRVNIDISPIAKFIHLITGKEFKAVTSSDFYKKLQTVPNFKTDKELINDLEAIKPLFKMVQLNEVVKMIENEIDLARNEIKQAKRK
jgi:hypothetical protein